jgi:hypothetical protein
LNKLDEEFGARGLKILSFTNESRECVLKYMSQLQPEPLRYTIGLKGGSGNYPSRGIPAAWLISAEGKVVWAGNPGGLSNKVIEEELKKVKITPEMKAARAEKALAYAESLLAEKMVLRGVAMLDKVVKDHKGSDAAKKAGERKAEIEKDETLKKELAAQKSLDKLVGGMEMPEKLKGKERDAKAVQLEGFIKKNEAEAPGAADLAKMWVKVMKEDWKVEK